MKISIIVILFIISTFATAEEVCNKTQLDLFTHFSLAQQNQLNKTFTLIQQKVKTLSEEAHYVVNETVTYKIGEVRPSFLYFNPREKAQIVGNDTIIISGGRLDVIMPFSWTKIGALSNITGTGEAFGISDSVMFAKNISVEKGYVVYEVISYDNITFNAFGINITRIDPANTTKDDIQNLQKLFNNIMGVTTVKHILQDDIDKLFFYYLNQSLYDERRHITDHFEYTWVDPITTKGNLTIPFGLTDLDVDIEKEGMKTTYTSRIKDDPNWKCQYHGPFLTLNPNVYGSQEFVGFDIYKNAIRYAIERHFLDTQLVKHNWESRFFQFYAGDLYQVIPRVAYKFLPNDEVDGSCTASPNSLKIEKGGHQMINVTIDFDCHLNVAKKVVSNFKMNNLTFIVEGRAHSDHMKFHVIGFSKSVQFFEYDGYKVENLELAELMITHSMNRLLEEKVFGSDWPLFPKDYPHFIVEQNYTIVYDSTHADPTKIKTE